MDRLPGTGDFAQWTENHGIPTVEVELPDHSTTDFEANFSGFQALIARAASSDTAFAFVVDLGPYSGGSVSLRMKCGSIGPEAAVPSWDRGR